MLGQKIKDEEGIESAVEEVSGLGLLDITTKMEIAKTTEHYEGILSCSSGVLKGLFGCKIKGYEIHQGISAGREEDLFDQEIELKGSIKNNVVGTYVHGIFDNSEFTNFLLNRQYFLNKMAKVSSRKLKSVFPQN